MGIIAAKFGGSSAATGDRLRRVREIINSRSKRQYIILSAPGKRHSNDQKITDMLLEAHHTPERRDELLKNIRRRFLEIAKELDIDPGMMFDSLEGDVSHSADRAASRGEFYCAKLFAQYADMPFVDAAALIHFDKNGRLLRDETYESIRMMARHWPCAVIPGFYGSKPDGEIHTFSRGGSDITGALVAAALNADVYENWTDVDGLMSIDPAYCADCICHGAVSYRQMQEISAGGAQVLHPCCLEPVCEAGLPTVLRNTFAPEKPGTYISDAVRNEVPCVCVRAGLKIMEQEHLLKSLSGETFRGIDGQYLVLEAAADDASMITIFGLPEKLFNAVLRIAAPSAWLQKDGLLKLLVKGQPDPAVVQKIHEILIDQGFQYSLSE